MKVILDIKDDILADMQLLAEIQQKPLNEIIEETFIKYVKEPKQAIYEVYSADQKDVELFQELLYRYLTEAIEDMQDVQEESYQYDKQMIEVFKMIRDDILDDDRMIAKLYKTFKATR